MAEKSAEIHTLAPRLSYVEDKLDYLAENSGSGGGGRDEALWRITVTGAEPGYSFSDDPWTQTDLIYGPDSPSHLSMHQTIFGTNSAGAISCQDGKGFYGRVFSDYDTTWSYDESGTRTLVEDIFAGADFVSAMRALSTSLCRSIWHTDTTTLGYDRPDTIIGRIEKLTEDLQELRDDLESEIGRIENVVLPNFRNMINSELDAIRARLAAGGL
ncbi:hypothetical protein GOC43_28885 [Sinorhizobium meliloti]|nr:hypothetical protein [Sinorhizobium meliloti]